MATSAASVVTHKLKSKSGKVGLTRTGKSGADSLVTNLAVQY